MHSTSTGSYLQNPKSSRDGYIRLMFSAFLDIAFDRRFAWLDEDLRAELLLEEVPACQAGYCEWIGGAAVSRASVGWAWFRSSRGGQAFLAPGGISTNVMLVTSRSVDLGMRKTDSLLRAWLSGQTWQPKEIAARFDKVKDYPTGRRV